MFYIKGWPYCQRMLVFLFSLFLLDVFFRSFALCTVQPDNKNQNTLFRLKNPNKFLDHL